jgi:hypothetical protein
MCISYSVINEMSCIQKEYFNFFILNEKHASNLRATALTLPLRRAGEGEKTAMQEKIFLQDVLTGAVF